MKLTTQLTQDLGRLVRSQVWDDIKEIAIEEQQKARLARTTAGAENEFKAMRQIILSEGQELGIRQLITIIEQYAGSAGHNIQGA